jgi:hypothetical protein
MRIGSEDHLNYADHCIRKIRRSSRFIDAALRNTTSCTFPLPYNYIFIYPAIQCDVCCPPAFSRKRAQERFDHIENHEKSFYTSSKNAHLSFELEFFPHFSFETSSFTITSSIFNCHPLCSGLESRSVKLKPRSESVHSKIYSISGVGEVLCIDRLEGFHLIANSISKREGSYYCKVCGRSEFFQTPPPTKKANNPPMSFRLVKP